MKARSLVFLLVSGVALTACDRGEPGAVPAPSGSVDVVVSPAATGPTVSIHPATVVSTADVDIGTRTSGTLLRVRADVGSRVAAGDTLVEVDAADVRARVEGAEAEHRRARRYFERIRNLERDGAATSQELDDARAGLRRAEAALEEARAQVDYVVLRAPFDGVVTGRMADPGALTLPGRPVLSLARPEALEITADLPAGPGSDVREGDRFVVRDPDSGEARRARVVRVSPARDPASRRTRVELRFDRGEDLRGTGFAPGAFARLEREAPGTATVWIPADAVVRRGQLTGVFGLDGDSLDLRWLRLGLRRGDAVEVLAGIGPGERVVRRPDPDLTDRLPVGSVEEETWRPGSGP